MVERRKSYTREFKVQAVELLNSSGELVLLERKFNIGSDRVNRIVELPYTFTVVPPFGVGRRRIGASRRAHAHLDHDGGRAAVAPPRSSVPVGIGRRAIP
jgi:hypothetical protein